MQKKATSNTVSFLISRRCFTADSILKRNVFKVRLLFAVFQKPAFIKQRSNARKSIYHPDFLLYLYTLNHFENLILT